ncbi:MAG: AAA family ATPase [Myxococcales bacterium]|nr:AAA family ATPase [Myxococcales bacterium]
MLRSLRVSNYRSLGEDVRVEFGRFTALVGPNGSGKSNVVDALRFVSDAMHMGLSGAVTHRSGIDAVRRWSGGHPFDLRIEVELELAEGSAGHYGFVLTGASEEEYHVKSEEAWLTGPDGTGIEFRVEEGRWAKGPSDLRPPLNRQGLALQLVGGDERLSPLVDALRAVSIYSIFPDTLRAPQKYSPRKPMERHGENWVSILKDQPIDTWKADLVSALDKLTGDTVDIKIKSAAGYLVVEFEHRTEKKKRKWFSADQESDGTLRVAGIISALLQDPPVSVIGIEEPELTVHPGAISLLYDFLHQATERSQVIITTHSPEMLEHVDAGDVRVVERRDGVSSVCPMAWQQKKAVRDQLLTLGDLLRGPGIEQQDEDEDEPPPQLSLAGAS